MKNKLLTTVYILIFGVIITSTILSYNGIKLKPKQVKEKINTVIDEVNIYDTMSVTLVGDCTIGTDPAFGYDRSFTSVFDALDKDYGYFFRGVKDVVYYDDLTIANLETTFTETTKRAVKRFNFKGSKEYANILTQGSVEAVNIANNHIYDFLEVGYKDTVDTLEEIKMDYYGEGKYLIKEVKGIKIGLIGYYVIDNPNIYEDVEKGLKYLKEQNVDLIFVTYHWGIERAYKQNQEQVDLAHWTVDNGADLIIGHHPHVTQGIEKYKDKYIVYSLANFVFGGNKNPDDKDSFIFQINFDLHNGKVIGDKVSVIPVTVSSKKNVNDYQPQILSGTEKERVLNKILKSSVNFTKEDINED